MNTTTKKNNTLDSELSHSMVHYLLTIHKLKEQRGYARVTDIAIELKLTKGSVSTALNNLKKKGLVEEEENSKFLLLTGAGHDEVHNILSARTLIFYFLKDFIGVSKEIAEKDSCAMEHLMSKETSEKFFTFMKDLACTCESINSKGGDLPTNFQFKTALDLCNYKSSDEFVMNQVGDSYLSHNH
jgi:DtxR family Mn-dependent transcriptional regulator